MMQELLRNKKPQGLRWATEWQTKYRNGARNGKFNLMKKATYVMEMEKCNETLMDI